MRFKKTGAIRRPCVAMIGPALTAQGGVASVAAAWRDAGLFSRWRVIYLATYVEGSAMRKLAQALIMLARFAILLASGRVACLHAHIARQTSFRRKALFILPALVLRCPVIVHLHSGKFRQVYQEQCGALTRCLVRFVFDRADRIVVLGSRWEGFLRSVTRNRRIVVIPNFVSLPSAAASAPAQPPYVLFLGQLTRDKGFFDLLQAMARVRETHPQAVLKCGGNGDRALVHREIAHLCLQPAVHLLGWVGGDIKANLIRRATVFVLPSYQEGLPMGLLEAMSMGVPVITTRVGDIPDLVAPGIEGLLTVPGDVAALAEAIAKILADPTMRDRMGRQARNTVAERFSAQAVLPHLNRLYGRYDSTGAFKPSMSAAWSDPCVR